MKSPSEAGAGSDSPAKSIVEFSPLTAIGILFVLTLAMFADVLFSDGTTILSSGDLDLPHYFMRWRQFGFSELAHGNLPLWNPHSYSGMPFFGGFEPALLYPLNFVFLILPIGHAVNWSIALHVFLAGSFTFFWTSNRKLHPLACLVAAVLFMFSGPYFFHIFAGHLSNLSAMVWAPLLFFAIDKSFEQRWRPAFFLGSIAVAMQVLAGHPQYVFYTAIAAGVYSVLRLTKSSSRGRILLGLAAFCAAGVALSAVQLFTGLDEGRQTVRGMGVPFEYAAMFSFPPENLLTVLAPGFFGDVKTVPYWGSCNLWEMCLFFGVTGLMLAVCGVLYGEKCKRHYSLVMILVLLVFALGNFTPFFNFAYHWIPGFNRFRGSAKFIFLIALFSAMLAAVGLDALLRGKARTRTLAVVIASTGLVFVVTGMILNGADFSNPLNWCRKLMYFVLQRRPLVVRVPIDQSKFVFGAAHQLTGELFLAATLLLLLSVILWFARSSNKLLPGVAAIAILEMFVFARGTLDRFPASAASTPALKRFLEEHPGDYRILYTPDVNASMECGGYEIGGDSANILRRYSQFLNLSQRKEVSDRLLDLLRCRYIFRSGTNMVVTARTNALPHLQLVQRYQAVDQPEKVLAVLTNANFDPRREIILESRPNPEPVVSELLGTAKIISSSSDDLVIEAEVPSSTLLLVTDVYAKGWRARPLPESAQKSYEVLPADYCLRAVPLSAGRHLFRLEYEPFGFRIGKWVSLVSILLFLAGMIGWMRHRKA